MIDLRWKKQTLAEKSGVSRKTVGVILSGSESVHARRLGSIEKMVEALRSAGVEIG